MSRILIALIPFITGLIFIALVLSRKGEFSRVKRSWRKYDWMTFFAGVFGGVLFSSAMRSSGFEFQSAVQIIATIVSAGILVLVLVAVIRRTRAGRPIAQPLGDERTEMILAKSARNAFFATYLCMFINTCVNDDVTLDGNGMMIVLGCGLLVLLLSLLFYAYGKSWYSE